MDDVNINNGEAAISDDIGTVTEQGTALATKAPPSPPVLLADVKLPTESMYATITQTLDALTNTHIDGLGKFCIPKQLQAHNTKRFIPDTEIEMLHQHAVPVSNDDIKAFKEALQLKQSLQYRIEQLRMPAKTLAEITGARIRLAYRLVRYMTHIRGIGGVGQPLIFATAATNSQINLLELPLPYNPTVGWYRGLAAVRNLLGDVSEADYTYTYLFVGHNAETKAAENQIYQSKGMSILPPPLHDKYFPAGAPPWHYRRTNFTPEWYSPLSDGPLNTYLNIIEFLVRHLGIAEGTDHDEQAAAIALLNPSIARLAWPCSDDIETYEEYVLLPYLNRIAIEKSPVAAIEHIKREMGLTHAEAFDFFETAKTYSEQAFTFDANKERSLMINKLHGLAGECGEAGMVTTQLNSFKTILQVLGLTKHEEESNIDKREILAGVLEAEVVSKTKQLHPAGDN